jgi:hypothetical protein
MSKTAQIVDRYNVGNTSVLRRCAALGPFLVCLLAGGAQAGAWEEFQARCLDPYENLEPAVFDDLTKIDVPEPRIEVSRYGAHFALEDGAVLFSDPAPVSDGERLCGAYGSDRETELSDRWIEAQLAERNYEVTLETYAGRHTELQSTLWIEPRLTVSILRDLDAGLVTYQILETDLES